MNQREIRLGRLFERRKVLGHVNEPMLSVFREHGVVPKDQLLNHNKTAEDRSIYQLVEPGWLAVNRMKAWQGALGISAYRGIMSGHYICFAPRHREVDRFLHYTLRSPKMTAHFNSISRGVRPGQIEIDNDQLAATPILLPSPDEQRRIADFLDDRISRIDHVITARGTQGNLLDQLLLERMRSAVAGSLKLEKERGRTGALAWIDRISEEALVLPLARVLTLQRGVDLTEDRRRPGSVPVVTTAGVVGTHDTAIESGPGVVVGRYGSVGNVHWVDGPYWPHNTTLYVKDTRGNNLRWLYYLLRTFPYSAMQARAAIPGVNRNDMATELVPWIPRHLQEASVQQLDEWVLEHERQRADLDRSVDRLRDYKQSLISAAVTGEIDVSTAGSGIPG